MSKRNKKTVKATPPAEAPKQCWFRKFWASIKWGDVSTWLVIVFLSLIVSLVGWFGRRLYSDYQERTRISEEIQHRISIAEPYVVSDVHLAKKYLDCVDPQRYRHPEYKQVSLQELLSNWEAAGGANLGPELLQLAKKPSPSNEELQRLIALLVYAFPTPDAGPGLLNSDDNEPNSDGGRSEASPQGEANPGNSDANQSQENPNDGSLPKPASKQPDTELDL